MKIGKSGYKYKEGESEVERLKNKLATVFLAIESSKCDEPIIKKAKGVLLDIAMLVDDIEEFFIKNKSNRVGEVFMTNEGCKMEILQYFNSQNSTIKFEDGTIKNNIKYSLITRGRIKNPNKKSVQGVGFFGEGQYNFKNNKECYKVWEAMIKRGYSEEYNNRNSYKDVYVCDLWHNFQNFAEWFYNKSNYKKGFDLDKDLLVKGNKMYSPETSCFIPPEINSSLVESTIKRYLPPGVKLTKHGKFNASLRRGGKKVHIGNYDTIHEAQEAYKKEKKEWIRELADKYKEELNEQIYNALINYKIS